MLSLIFLVAGDKTDRMTRVVLGKFAHYKGSVRIPKVLFLSYFEKLQLILLTQ